MRSIFVLVMLFIGGCITLVENDHRVPKEIPTWKIERGPEVETFKGTRYVALVSLRPKIVCQVIATERKILLLSATVQKDGFEYFYSGIIVPYVKIDQFFREKTVATFIRERVHRKKLTEEKWQVTDEQPLKTFSKYCPKEVYLNLPAKVQRMFGGFDGIGIGEEV